VAGKSWRKHGDHPEVAKLKGAKDSPEWDCPVPDCDAPLTAHGLALVGPSDYPVMVHPGDQIEGGGPTLIVASHGMRYHGGAELD
jgi:hypothetical protein